MYLYFFKKIFKIKLNFTLRFTFSVKQIETDRWNVAFELYAKFKEQMSLLIKESEDGAKNPFLAGKFGKTFESFEKLKKTKNQRHSELIKTSSHLARV